MLLKIVLYVLIYLLCLSVFAVSSSLRVRQCVLLAASYLLYFTWEKWFGLALVVSTLVNFLFGNWLRHKQSSLVLSLGIAWNVLLLCTFKYLPEAGHTSSLPVLQALSQLVLPLGISFWSFQAMSYLFDQYREEDLDPDLLEFAASMSFFPVIFSGPICRLSEMLPQLRSDQSVSVGNVLRGGRRVAIGVLMMLVARLLGQGVMGGEGVEAGFDRLTDWGAIDVWLLAVGYGMQLFFNFAGFTNIVIGAAAALGITVPENFNVPFASTTPSIFWTRWHMSLSFWIRDYVFLPLAMIRRESWWRNAILVAAMVLFGLWHGASMLFLLWGAYHGCLLLVQRILQGLMRRWDLTLSGPLWELLGWFGTATAVSLGWILFRAHSLIQAKAMYGALIAPDKYGSQFLPGSFTWLVLAIAVLYALVSLLANHMASAKADSSNLPATLVRTQWYWMPSIYVIAVVIVFILGLGSGGNTAALMYGRF